MKKYVEAELVRLEEAGEGQGGRGLAGAAGDGRVQGFGDLVRGKLAAVSRPAGTRWRRRDGAPPWSPEDGGAGVAAAPVWQQRGTG